MLHAALPVKLSKYFSHLAKSIDGLVMEWRRKIHQNFYSGCCARKHLITMWQTGKQFSVTEKVIFRETEDKNLSKSGASSRRCVSARQRIGNYLPKLLGTQRNADKENFSS